MVWLRTPLRLLVVWSLVVGLCLGTAACKRRPADVLPPGTESDTVIRFYGTPKGRAASGEREIWIYPTFQVGLENGKVVSVGPVKGEKETGSKGVRSQESGGGLDPKSKKDPKVETPPAVAPPVAKASPSPAPTPAKPAHKLFSRRQANPDEPEAPSALWGWFRIVIGMVVVIGFGQGTALVIKHRARLREMLARRE